MICSEFEEWFSRRFRVEGKRIKANDGSNVREQDVMGKWSDYIIDHPNLKDLTYGDFKKFISGFQVKKDEDKFVFNTEVLCDWMSVNSLRWSVSEDGRMITRIEGGLPRSGDIDDLTTDIYADHIDRGLSVSKESIKTILVAWLNTRQQSAAVKLKEKMTYDPSYVPKTDSYIAAMYRYLKPSQPFEIFKMMVYHWGWQTKRKVMGKKVINHIWLSFFGGAGIGKTTMVRRLMEPFGCFATDTTLGKVLDSTKEIKLLTESYILNMDEIAVNREDGNQDDPLTKDQMNLLKSILTGEDITARVYGTQAQARRKISFTVISTSNEHLYNIIYDNATMRRYYEINCTRKERNSDLLDEFRHKCWGDGLNFWKGINENIEDGYWLNDKDEEVKSLIGDVAKFSAEVQKEQSMYYPDNKTTMRWVQYLREENNVGFTKNATAMDLYGNYREWCELAGCKKCSLPKFKDFFLAKFVPEICDAGCNLEMKKMTWCKWLGVEDTGDRCPF